jgi:hypothetical protein
MRLWSRFMRAMSRIEMDTLIFPAQYGTLDWFTHQLRVIDPGCEVTEHPTVPFVLRIRPSDPQYREALRERANEVQLPGISVSIVGDVDDFRRPEPEPTRFGLLLVWVRLGVNFAWEVATKGTQYLFRGGICK